MLLKSGVRRCYREFLVRSHDAEEQEYPDREDQIGAVLIHGNYLSQKDVELCLAFDVEALSNDPVIDGLRKLRATLAANYKPVEDGVIQLK